MRQRYSLLLLGVIAAAVLVTLLQRLPDHPTVQRMSAPTPVRAAVTVVIRDGVVGPGLATVPKGDEVALRVENHEPHDVRLELAGYEDAVSVRIAAGTAWNTSFIADRPGDDFAWLLDGEPAGRFAVSGSHLVEGHR